MVGFDEWLRATPEVRREIVVYMFGRLAIPVENEMIEIRCVPCVTLNPKAGETLEDQIGMDEGLLRRVIFVSMANVEIPEAIIGDGDERLAQATALGRVELPEPRHRDWLPKDAVAECLRRSLSSPDLLARIDVTMLAMLAQAATAWLEPEEALRHVLYHYLTIMEAR